jgi:hypothetical protein
MEDRDMLKKAFVTSICAAAVVGLGTGPVFAGEVTGNGKDTQGPAHTHSICAFSGQNDTPNDPFPEGGRVQSYGQLVRAGLKSDPMVVNPGTSCNGRTGFLAGGGEG